MMSLVQHVMLWAFVVCGILNAWSFVSSPLVGASGLSLTTTGQRRGLYVQIYTNKVGSLNVDTEDKMRFAYILDDDGKVTDLIRHLNLYKFTAVSFYNLWAVLNDEDHTAKFRGLVKRLRSEVKTLNHVEGISDETLRMWELMAEYQNDSTDSNEMLDGFVTEIEFWNGQSSANTLLDCITTMKNDYDPANRISGVPLHYMVYIGARVSDETLLETMVNSGLVTMFYVAAYVEVPADTASTLNSASRTVRSLQAAAEKRRETEATFTQRIGVILSAEGTKYAAGSEYFMGDWLLKHFRPFSAISQSEVIVADGIDPSLGNAVTFDGFQWYEYIFTGLYMADDPAAKVASSAAGLPTGLGALTLLGWIFTWALV